MLPIEKLKKVIFEEIIIFKDSVRATIGHHRNKLFEYSDKEAKLVGSMINNVTGIVLPSIFTSAKQRMKQHYEKSLPDLKKEIKTNLELLPFKKRLEAVEKIKEFGNNFDKNIKEEKTKWEKREEEIRKNIGLLEQEFRKIQSSMIGLKGFFKKIFKREAKSIDALKQKGSELIYCCGEIFYVRLYLYYLSLLEECLVNLVQWLSNEVVPEITRLIGKVEECVHFLETRKQEIQKALETRLNFEIDLQSIKKIEELVETRITQSIIEESALSFKDGFKQLSANEIIEKLLKKEFFSDILEVSAVERLRELYSDRKMGHKIKEYVEKEAAPFNPLNSELLTNDPLRLVVIGLEAANGENKISDILSQYLSNYSIGKYPDPEKIVILTSIHRIPVYSLAGVNEWLAAAKKKEQEGRFAIYPERRWKEYRPITPWLSEIKVNNLIALGIASQIIKFYGPGFYSIDGKKIHGIKNLQNFLSTATTVQHDIIEKWLSLFKEKGLKGVLEKIEEAINSSSVSPQFSEIQSHLKKIYGKLKDLKEASEEIVKEKLLEPLT